VAHNNQYFIVASTTTLNYTSVPLPHPGGPPTGN